MGRTRAPCWADSVSAGVGSLDPRVIQEPGLTHTFLLQVRSCGRASVLSQSDGRQREDGKDEDTFLNATHLKSERIIYIFFKRIKKLAFKREELTPRARG